MNCYSMTTMRIGYEVKSQKWKFFEKNAAVKNQGTKQRIQRIPGDSWQWETNGQCIEGDNCSFRHDVNKRGKVAPSNPSPNSFMQQNERKASRTRSPRGRSPSGRMSRWSCKDYLKGTCNNSFCERWHPPECLFCQTKSGCVNTIPPDTEIHEQMIMTNGYVKVCTTTSTPSTTVRPLWTTT